MTSEALATSIQRKQNFQTGDIGHNSADKSNRVTAILDYVGKSCHWLGFCHWFLHQKETPKQEEVQVLQNHH